MKPQLSITEIGTHWVDLDHPVSGDLDDGYAGIPDGVVAVHLESLRARLDSARELFKELVSPECNDLYYGGKVAPKILTWLAEDGEE